MSLYRDLTHHRQVALTVNLKPTVEEMNKHFLRLIEEVKPLFFNGGRLANKIQKRWYGQQLVDSTTGFTYGFIWFTVTNRAVMKNTYNIDDPESRIDELEFSFHIKQNETIALANNFVSGSLRYRTGDGEFDIDKTPFMLYGGCDVESALLFKDLVEKIKSNLTSFKADDTTFVAQNEVYKLGFIMHNS